MGRETGHLTGLMGLILVLSAGGCVAKMYAGPERPARDTVLLEPNETEIRILDGVDLRTRSRLAVLPGAHALLINLTVTGYEKDLPAMVCFWAEAGHRYEVRPGKQDYLGWRAAIVDEATGTALPTIRGALDEDCISQITARATRPSWPAELAAAPPPPPLPPPLPERSALRSASFALALDTGFSLGWGWLGVTNSAGHGTTHDAGNTFSLSLVGFWTPLWFGDALGIGIGAAIGVKTDLFPSFYADGSTLASYPAAGEIHAFVHFGERGVLLLRAGVEKDLDLAITGGGFDTHFPTKAGGFGDVSLAAGGPEGPISALAIGLRYTAVTCFSQAGAPVDVGSVGLHLLVGWKP